MHCCQHAACSGHRRLNRKPACTPASGRSAGSNPAHIRFCGRQAQHQRSLACCRQGQRMSAASRQAPRAWSAPEIANTSRGSRRSVAAAVSRTSATASACGEGSKFVTVGCRRAMEG
eukprot:351946-Chlamydomonas_euryale.AAC.2